MESIKFYPFHIYMSIDIDVVQVLFVLLFLVQTISKHSLVFWLTKNLPLCCGDVSWVIFFLLLNNDLGAYTW